MESPLVIWDGYGLRHAHSGIGRHAAQLHTSLVAIGIRPLVLASSPGSWPETPYSFLAKIQSRPHRLKVKHRYVLSGELSSLAHVPGCPDVVVHGLSNFNIPTPLAKFPREMRRIVTIHDAIPLIVPSQVSRVLALQMAWMLPRVLNDCDVALAVSQWTADWLAAKFPQNSHKITVMPNGFPEWRGGSNLVSRETEPLKALCVSRWESYKRLDRLVDIVQNARGAVQVTLVTDAKGRVYAEENGRDLLAKGWLRLLNGLSDTELTDAYHEHHVYLHPSEWEGFCLPAAEALAHGLSVVYQKGSGIDEVVGPCGIGLSPDASIDDWCETLIRREWNMSQSDIYDWVQIQPKWNDIAYRLAAVYNRSSRLLDKPNFAPRKRSLHAPSVK